MDRYHLLPCALTMTPGLEIRRCVCRLLRAKLHWVFRDGPAITDDKQKLFWMKDLDDMLHDLLEGIFEVKRYLFLDDVTSLENVRKC